MSDADVKSLTAAERLSLIHKLWDSLSDDEAPLTDAQRAELDRRLASFADDRAEAVSWAALKSELQANRA